MTISYVPLAMFGVLFAVLALGIPIAFSLCFISIIFAWSLWGFGGVSLLTTAVWGTMRNAANQNHLRGGLEQSARDCRATRRG